MLEASDGRCLGPVFQKGDKFYGLTCHHIANCIATTKAYETIGQDKVQRCSDALDCCFFELTGDVTCNLAFLKIDATLVKHLPVGKPVVKLGGAATGLTRGTFVGLIDYKTEGKGKRRVRERATLLSPA